MSRSAALAAPLEIRGSSWAGDPPQRAAARERLIDATARCIVRGGIGSASVSAVADEAGVSRPTVYRYFEDRHALVMATMLRAGRVLAGGLAEHLRRFPQPARKAIEAEVYVVNEVPLNPLLSEVWNTTLIDAAMLADLTHPEIIALAREAVAGLEAAAGWNDAEADEAVELMLRMQVSLLVAPDPRRTDDELRGFLERRLVPSLGLTSEPPES
ncbi:MAG: TetR/AcrR family transcriptional regulator [Myxococcota bacterium]